MKNVIFIILMSIGIVVLGVVVFDVFKDVQTNTVLQEHKKDVFEEYIKEDICEIHVMFRDGFTETYFANVSKRECRIISEMFRYMSITYTSDDIVPVRGIFNSVSGVWK